MARQARNRVREPRTGRGRALLAAVLMGVGVLPALVPTQAGAITGGIPVPHGGYSFVAEIRNTAVGGLCTGSLIHPSWVLTAAHCSVPTSVGDMTVRVGNNMSGTGGEVRRLTRILRHPEYQGGHNDVALLELSSPVTNVTPVQLATPADAPLWDGVQGGPFTPFDQGQAIGWGQNAAGALPSQLQTVIVNITPWQVDGLGIKRIMVDGGPCNGDSGGPLLVWANGSQVQAGVVKSASCGVSGSYSEVGAGRNRDWLLSQLTRLPYTAFGVKDWDRDGHQDIITRQDATAGLWVYPGESRRGTTTTQREQIGAGWLGHTSFGVTDWDRDGHQDIITRHDATGDLWLHPGESRRGTTTTPRVLIGSGWQGYTPFGLTDWDRDGHQDIVTRQNNTGELWTYPGESRRGQSTTPRARIGVSWNGYSPFGVTDWDRDGHQDVLTRQNDTGDLWIYPGESRSSQASAPRVRIGNGWTGYTSFGATDWDRDGHQDIITRHDATGNLWIYPGESRRGTTTTQRVQIGNGW